MLFLDSRGGCLPGNDLYHDILFVRMTTGYFARDASRSPGNEWGISASAATIWAFLG